MPEFEHTIIEKIQLPSRGVVYGDKLPGGNVELAPMRTKEEKLLASTHNRETVLERIVKRCLLTTSLPFENYLVSDFFFMLLVIRNLSYGSDYRFKVTCSHCAYVFEHYMEVPGGFEIMYLPDGVLQDADGNVPAKFEEPFEVDLPICKKKVNLRLIRLQDEEEIRRVVEQIRQKPDDGDPDLEVRLAKHIVSVDDNKMDLRESIDFVSNLYVRDTRVIKRAIADNDCGANLLIEPKCLRCGTVNLSRFRFTPGFFR